ncbi:MAG: hypothetical protein K2I97_00460 [Alistipes sp.]|nr:hypothetical protein [Alistipes sp.]
MSLCCACADDGAVPAVEPDPEPEPEQSEPFLTVSPDTLFYDLSGNPLDASEFTVKTKCDWQLSVPEQADWCEASATFGQCDASVSFRLGGDPCYRVAELTFAAIAEDGKPVISCPVFIQQGEKPDVDPTEPSDPDERPTDPSDPDNPSDPDKDPETSPAIPEIESVNPTALVWSANESGVVRQVDVTVKNFDNHVLSNPKITGADAGRFTASVNGRTVYVKTAGTNDTAADYRATLEISVADGNSMSVSLLQSKRESEPDNGDSGDNSDGDSNGDGDGGDDGDGDGGDGGEKGEETGEPNDPPGGGCDDFATLTPDYLRADLKTDSGWKGFSCAVYSGDNGNDTAPYFRSLLGSLSSVRGLAL